MVKHWLKQHFYLNIADVTWKFWSNNLLIKNFLWNQHSIVKKNDAFVGLMNYMRLSLAFLTCIT